MEKIHGLIDAPFTPFYENGEVNYEPIEAYCQLLVRNGLQGVFINGSSGEGYMLTEDERMKLAERWMEVAPGRIQSHCPCRKHLCKIKQTSSRTRSENRSMGYRSNGTSFPQSRTH